MVMTFLKAYTKEYLVYIEHFRRDKYRIGEHLAYRNEPVLVIRLDTKTDATKKYLDSK